MREMMNIVLFDKTSNYKNKTQQNITDKWKKLKPKSQKTPFQIRV